MLDTTRQFLERNVEKPKNSTYYISNLINCFAILNDWYVSKILPWSRIKCNAQISEVYNNKWLSVAYIADAMHYMTLIFISTAIRHIFPENKKKERKGGKNSRATQCYKIYNIIFLVLDIIQEKQGDKEINIETK